MEFKKEFYPKSPIEQLKIIEALDLMFYEWHIEKKPKTGYESEKWVVTGIRR